MWIPISLHPEYTLFLLYQIMFMRVWIVGWSVVSGWSRMASVGMAHLCSTWSLIVHLYPTLFSWWQGPRERAAVNMAFQALELYKIISTAFYWSKQITWPNSNSGFQEIDYTPWEALLQNHIGCCKRRIENCGHFPISVTQSWMKLFM